MHLVEKDNNSNKYQQQTGEKIKSGSILVPVTAAQLLLLMLPLLMCRPA